jgi:hypothetical protein
MRLNAIKDMPSIAQRSPEVDVHVVSCRCAGVLFNRAMSRLAVGMSVEHTSRNMRPVERHNGGAHLLLEGSMRRPKPVPKSDRATPARGRILEMARHPTLTEQPKIDVLCHAHSPRR